MDRFALVVRRYGLALLLTAALVGLFFGSTLPALAEWRQRVGERAAVEESVERQREDVRRRELWLRGAEQDPMIRERLLDARERSPDLTGPRFETTPDGEGEVEGR